ncbi:MAG: DUF2442 domain-containing protein [bacterium]|nr:DUF2442 domain-containing protein [bacterium]
MKYMAHDTATRATSVRVADGIVWVTLSDAREIHFPASKSRRLANATASALAKVELICNGTGLHWPELDEDLSLQGIIEGRFGGATQAAPAPRKAIAADTCASYKTGAH